MNKIGLDRVFWKSTFMLYNKGVNVIPIVTGFWHDGERKAFADAIDRHEENKHAVTWNDNIYIKKCIGLNSRY